MNLDGSISYFAEQGPIFWAATAAVGVGGTMLVVSLGLTLRKLGGRIRNPFAAGGPLRRRKTPPLAPRVGVVPTATGYAPVPVANDPPALDRQVELIVMRDRLRAAGDRLEGLLGRRSDEDSALKSTAERVETVFKAGVG